MGNIRSGIKIVERGALGRFGRGVGKDEIWCNWYFGLGWKEGRERWMLQDRFGGTNSSYFARKDWGEGGISTEP